VARRLASLVVVSLLGHAVARADAQPAAPAPGGAAPAPIAPPPDDVLDKKIAVWRFDALGIDPEIVQRLETLFRNELDRLDRVPLPTQRTVERTITDPRQRECTGEEKCLAQIGKQLGVDLVVTGTVGSLGDNYVLTIKAVDVATAHSQKIQSDPLRGSPDDLIEGVRVAAYRLLAPEQLHGAVEIESDLVGAAVTLDGKPIGKTPLPDRGVVGKLALGKHHLRVEAARYEPIDQDVEVHFQKVSPVLVRLLPSEVTGTGRTYVVERRPFYTRTWFIIAAGAAAIAIGAAVGSEIFSIKHCMPNGPGLNCP
jgi:PEGA domain-containing protein